MKTPVLKSGGVHWVLNVMFRPLEDDDDMDAGEDEEFVEGAMVPDDSDDSDVDT